MMVSVGSGLSKNDLLWSSGKDLYDGLCCQWSLKE